MDKEVTEVEKTLEAESSGATERKRSRRDVAGIILLCIDAVFTLVLLASGFNFLALPALVLAIATAVFMLARSAKGRPVGKYAYAAFLTVYAGIFLYFLIWSAESFGKRLWWNLVLCLFPVAFVALIPVTKKFLSGKACKAIVPVMLALAIATSAVYALFMNLRVRPTVDRMWEGHDEYLSSVKQRKRGLPTCS